MKIVADRNIPYIKEAVKPLGEVLFLPGGEIDADSVRDADILLTRTRTRCDARLLAGSRCSFIGTATIGTDHIDLDYCRDRGINVVNAPGCNAPAVAQYVLSAIRTFLPDDESFKGKRLGIIGVGNVGSILNRWALSLGMETLLNDPPKADSGDTSHSYTSLDEIAAKADFISIHTPYTKGGDYPTHHLIDSTFLGSTLRHPVIINAARGGVTDTEALKAALREGSIAGTVIDCWEGEPDIDRELLAMSAVGTPHIAGYSAEGKIRASRMVLEALESHLRDHFGLDVTPGTLTSGLPAVAPVPAGITAAGLDYDIKADNISRHVTDPAAIATQFESLRNDYNLRREPH